MVRRILALLFGAFGAASVLLLAYARHAGIDAGHPLKAEYINIAANLMMPHALLGLFALSQYSRIGRFSCLAALLIGVGFALFAAPLLLMAFGVFERTPTAPFGGFAFALSWLVLGFGFLVSKDAK